MTTVKAFLNGMKISAYAKYRLLDTSTNKDVIVTDTNLLSNSMKIIVTAQDGSTSTYTFTVKEVRFPALKNAVIQCQAEVDIAKPYAENPISARSVNTVYQVMLGHINYANFILATMNGYSEADAAKAYDTMMLDNEILIEVVEQGKQDIAKQH